MGLIMDMTVSAFSKALLRFAPIVEGVKAPEQVQIIIGTKNNETSEPYFRVFNNWKPIENEKAKEDFVPGEFSFKQLNDIKLDLMGKEMLATPFLADCIRKFAEKENIDPDKVNMVILTEKELKAYPVPFLFNEFVMIRQIEWEVDIFDDETKIADGDNLK